MPKLNEWLRESFSGLGLPTAVKRGHSEQRVAVDEGASTSKTNTTEGPAVHAEAT